MDNEAKVLNWKYPLDGLRTFEIHAIGPFTVEELAEIDALLELVKKTMGRCQLAAQPHS